MNFAPLWADGPVIAAHAVMALTAAALGASQLVLPKGTVRHRWFGRLWVGMLAFVALSSFAISDMRWIGPFGPIHLLSIFTLVNLWLAVRSARCGDIKEHRSAMRSLYGLALLLAGAFTLLPGRTMHAVVFGS